MQSAIKTAGKGHSGTEPNRRREGPRGHLNSDFLSKGEKEQKTKQKH